MKRQKCEAGWFVEPQSAGFVTIDFDQPTRIASVDLLSEKTAIRAQEALEPCADQTRVASIQIKRELCAHKRTAEFLPASGRRAAGDLTMPWSVAGQSAFASVKERLARIRESLGGRKRLAIFAFAAVMAGAAVSFTIGRQKAVERKPESVVVSASSKESSPKTVKASPVDAFKTETNPPTDPSICPRDAIDALIDGNFEAALEMYRKLDAAFPRDESFGLAVEILSQSGRGGVR